MIRPETIDRLLIRGTNWVGDAVMSVPALREIRRIFPRARISLLVRPWVRSAYEAADFLDEILVLDKEGDHRGISGYRRLIRTLKQHDFQLALLLQNAFEAAFIARACAIPLRAGYARDGRGLLLTHRCRMDPEIRRVHQVYYYLDILSGLGLLPPKLWRDTAYRPDIRLSVCGSDRARAQALLRRHDVSEQEPVIGINPGAAFGSAKRWPHDRYAAVADRLSREHRARIVIFGSAAEREIALQVARHMQEKPVVLAGETTLGELMALIERALILITNDSGPMHLAAALDRPQVAIFGSTSEVATGPWSPRSRVVRHPVSCSPCFLRECPIDFRCMTSIGIDEVVDRANHAIR